MKKLMIILGFFLASLSVSAQGFTFEYFNPIDRTFTLEDWQLDQLIRELEERVLLINEVVLLDSLNQSITEENRLLNIKVSNLSTLNNNLISQNNFLNSTVGYQNDIINNCEGVQESGVKAIKKLQYDLKLSKIHNKWLKLSTGATTLTLVAIIVRELTKN